MSYSEGSLLVSTQFVVYGICWFVLAFAAKHSKAAYFWATYNLSQALSFGLLDNVAILGPIFLHAGISFAILGYFFSSAGMDIFLHKKLKFGNYWILFGCLGFACLFAAPVIGYDRAITLSINLPAILFSLTDAILFRSQLDKEFGKLGLFCLIPSFLFGLFAIFSTVNRLVSGITPTQALEPGSRFKVYLVVTLVVATLNVVFLSLYISRLILTLKSLATTDALTGLLNRREIKLRIENESSRASRNNMPLSLAFIDIDHFKRINDLGGHELGDRVLKVVALALKESFRSIDEIGRWGGEEFIILMPQTNLDDASLVIERVHKNLKLKNILDKDKLTSLTISAGLVCSTNGNRFSIDELIRNADEAMYEAKRTGRNRTIIYKEGVVIPAANNWTYE